MKKNVKVAGIAMLAAALVTGICCVEAKADDVKTINMYTMGIGNTTDYKVVQDAINEISREKIGVEVNWTILDIGQWFEQYNLLLSGSESVDLMPNLGGIAAGVRQGSFLELEERGSLEFREKALCPGGSSDSSGLLYGLYQGLSE